MALSTLGTPDETGIRSQALRLRITLWWILHRRSVLYCGIPLALGGVIRFWNIWGSPGMTNDDEGTYVSQAWAVLHNTPWQFAHNLQLTHYTYWYDHPFFGWLQIAGWEWLTNGFARYDVAIMVGRELVVVYAIVAAALMYMLCRSFDVNRGFSAAAVALMLVNPLGMTAGRMAYLDGLSVPWVIGSLLAARLARNHRGVIWSALALAGAVMTKETTLVFAGAILPMVIVYSPKKMRVYNTFIWSVLTFVLGGGLYLWYAANRGELLPGKGHVSVWTAAVWQVASRGGSGWIFSPTSLAHETFMRWARDDWYLLAAGLVLLPFVLFSKRLWPIGLAAVLNGALLLRTGYLPTPFVVILLPLAALVVAMGLDRLWRGTRRWLGADIGLKSLAIAISAAALVVTVPSWQGKFATDLTVDNVSPERAAVAWMQVHVPAAQHARIVTDDYVWPDLITRGYRRSDVDWFYKLDADPAVMKRYTSTDGNPADGWTWVDYVILPNIGQGIINTRLTLADALKHATRVATFKGQTNGEYSIYKIDH